MERDPTAPKWTALVRVTPLSNWCVYGPMTHREALAFRQLKAGTGIECHVALLLDPPRNLKPETMQ